MRPWRSTYAGVPDHVRIELIDMLFQTRVPLAIAGCTLALVAFRMASASGAIGLYALSAAGLAVTMFRIGCETAYHRRASRGAIAVAEAERWERLYAWSSFVFAGLIGALGAIAFSQKEASHQLLATALVFGFAAGIVCSISIRPAPAPRRATSSRPGR